MENYLTETARRLSGSLALPLKSFGKKRITCEPPETAPWCHGLRECIDKCNTETLTRALPWKKCQAG